MTDLSSLLNTTPDTESKDEAEDAAAILLLSIKTSLEERDKRINTQAADIEVIKNQISSLFKYVTYLLEQDPVMSKRMKAIADAAQTKAPENAEG